MMTANQPAIEPRAQLLRGQSFVNRIMRGMLRAPLLSRAAGGRLVVVYVVGRKSGQVYPIPVAYTAADGVLLIGTPFGWARNMRTGEPVDILLKGKRRQAGVEVFTDEHHVVEQFAIMARDNHQFAKFNKIALDGDGNPSPEDLHLAWAAGARAIRLIPQ
jgi:hypothetical protein